MLQNILLIDDSQLDRFVTEQVIKKNNFASNVISVRSSEEAIAWLISMQHAPALLPQLILLGFNMPEGNALEFISQYESHKAIRNKCTMFLVSSSLRSKPQMIALQSKLVSGFVKKPFTQKSLDALHNYLLQQQKTRPGIRLYFWFRERFGSVSKRA